MIDGALYLNYSEDTRTEFLAENDKRIAAAQTNWPAVSKDLANGAQKPYLHIDDPEVKISHPQPLE